MTDWVTDLADSVNRRAHDSRQNRDYALYRDRLFTAKIPLLWESCVSVLNQAVIRFNTTVTAEHNHIHLSVLSTSRLALKFDSPPYLRQIEASVEIDARSILLKVTGDTGCPKDRRLEIVINHEEHVYITDGPNESIVLDQFAELVLKLLLPANASLAQ